MDKFDEKVIGYESTKDILRQILDILKRPEVYKRKGISIPRGLLMESDPGLGKSLLASILMEESERKPFVFRKTSQENSFLDELRAVFAMAKEDAPSILLLEDLNLYVESNSPYAPEWACLQACIDDAKDTDLFVIATTNDTRYMPPSLLRPGRFDYVIYLQPPIGENAENIVSYYLRNKDLAEDVLISDIVKAMPKVSCATLETVMNLAALNSVYQSHEHIQKEDIIEALLQVVYKLQKTDKETDSSELQKIAVHEAAHAVVGEVLHPGSIGIVTVRGSQGVIGGMANIGQPMHVCTPTGEGFVKGTSFSAPWIARKMAYLICTLGFSREIAKALIIDAAAGWNRKDDVSCSIGYGVVPQRIENIVKTADDEIRFVMTGTTDAYETYTYRIPVPIYKDKQPFYARATLCYFPKCMRDQGVDYTSTEMDIHFGRVVETKGKASISPINSNSQGDEGGKHLYEPEARQLYRKWDNVKLISEELKDRAVPRKVYGAGMWGLSIKTKERLKEKNGRGLSFGVVVTLKEMYGENRIDDFIKLCMMRGWVVNRIDVENQIDIYNKAEEEIEF